MVELLLVFALLGVLAAVAALLWKRRAREPETHHEETYQHRGRGDGGPG